MPAILVGILSVVGTGAWMFWENSEPEPEPKDNSGIVVMIVVVLIILFFAFKIGNRIFKKSN
tara:strand:- start:2003 stop:2188 length:186 start_codon:yes stop_codon:yes gene_type:complete